MRGYVILLIFVAGCFHPSSEITTTHHDKPAESSIHVMATSMTNRSDSNNETLTNLERQKRLLPYVNFYQNHGYNQIAYEKFPLTVLKKTHYNEHQQNPDVIYQQKNKFTPFSTSNAIPGVFKPILQNQQPQTIKVQYFTVPQNKAPNYSELYDKLAQLKLSQQYRRPTYIQPVSQQTYILKPHIYNEQKVIPPSKTTIETYTPTNIDIPSGSGDTQYEIQNKPFVNHQIAVEVPYGSIAQEQYARKPYHENRKPFIIVPAAHQNEPNKPIIFIQRKPVLSKKPISYELPKYVPTYENQYKYKTITSQYEEPQYEPFPKYENPPNYEDIPEYETTPAYVEYNNTPYNPPSKNSINLSLILKHLQSTNTLPKTLTPDNIDNSIKTLVKILNALKKQHKNPKPILVSDEKESEYLDVENEAGVGISGHPNELSDAENEIYPEDTEEGGTPGKPGIDYPALSSIPQTSFNCKTQRYKGFFGDPDTNCQVWHYCDLNGGQASFLCPNGTIFSQVALTCDWWYNVKCSSTAQLYVLNERLYKYIIPLSPKFPEDYTGPLVDKYLALKFQEMEDKMKKEKKGKGNLPNDDEDKKYLRQQEVTAETAGKESVNVEPSLKNLVQKETLETVEEDNEN